MTTSGYIVNAILGLLLPAVLVASVARMYLHTIPTGGDDLVLEGALAGAGVLMGIVGALTTHLRHDGRKPLARAGFLAAALWVGGVGGRMAFAYASDHGLGPTIRRF